MKKMDITKYPRQIWYNTLEITKKLFALFCLSIVVALCSLTALPAMSAPVLEFNQRNFTGIFGVDYPVLDFMVDINDGEANTTDYFFEWTLLSRDSSNNIVDSFTHSVFGHYESRLLDGYYGDSLSPTVGDYTLTLSMSTFHQVGGLPECGPHSGCWDYTKPFNELFTSDTMSVQLSSVPIPAAAWLFGSGLMGLVGLARRKKS